MSSATRLSMRVVVAALLAGRAHAQVTETPVAFDSAGKVRTLTPALVTRFDLKAPTWPVQGNFLEARLFAISTGGRVLAVERQSGAVDRYPFGEDETQALRSVVDAAMTRSGALVTESRADVISEPARGAFVRNQMLLTWGVYGPLLASLTNDAKTGTALYLLATGASYFITTGIGKKTTVTRAQNHLSTDGALRGAATAAGLLYAFAGERSHENTYTGIALAGALGGTIAGFGLGRGRTDSEAEATTTISNLAALTAAGVSGATGAFENNGVERSVVGGIVAAGLAGYALGPNYPRRARYAVTRGDVQMLSTGALLGAAAAVTPFADSDAESEIMFAAATSGMLGGVLFSDRLMVRRFDYSTSDATQVGLGLAAGALLGGALVVLIDPSDTAVGMGLVTLGAIAGTVAGHHLADPPRAGAARVGSARIPGVRNARWQVHPTAVAFGLGRVPGRHALLTLRF
jgi:hypothetical protein